MSIADRFSLMFILGVMFMGGDCRLLDFDEPTEALVKQAICSSEFADEPARIEDCIRTKQIKELDEKAKADARLVCRDVKYLVLAHNPGIFVIEILNKARANLRYVAVSTNTTQEVQSDLMPKEPHQIRLRRLSTNGISMPESTEDIKTLPSGYHPTNVTSITIMEMKIQSMLTYFFRVKISFSPSRDRPCFYELRCKQNDGEYDQVIHLRHVEDFSTVFNSLPLGGNFTLTIKSLTETLRWGDLNNVRGTTTTFSTPRCSEYGLWGAPKHCVPGAVRYLNATATHKTGNIFDVYLTWNKPDYVDSMYKLTKYSIDIQPTGGGVEDRVSQVVAGEVRFLPPTNVVIRNVEILDQYDVNIRARNDVGWGPRISRRFTTGLKRIVPTAVEGLNAKVNLRTENTFDIHVTWDWPEIIPDFYIVNVLLNSSDTNHSVFHNISGSANETIFLAVKISEEFNVSVRAWRALAGGGPEITQRFIRPWTPNDRIDVPEDIRMPTYLGGTISIMVIGIGIAAYAYYRLRKRRLNKNMPVDKFEMSSDRLTITRVLGTGAFGIVKLATLRDDQGNVTNVAVKMLQDDSIENELRSFLDEINLMKSIDKHPNIVSLLGCCTTSRYPFLVVEYCSRGDLQTYLRKSLRVATTVTVGEMKKRSVVTPIREEILQENGEDSFSSGMSEDYIEGPGFPENRDTNSDVDVVTMMDMLNFGRQIATGMEFLSSNRIVHRDLATRNILVCHNRSVKISDFGLSRDVYQENFYKKWGNGRMPLKWMAIEALTHQVYSTHSDVWSFGILLWEIVTLGGSPYPGVPIIRILPRLLSGYRMTQPANCSLPLYNVMLSCWQERPKNRPSFTILRQELDKLISDIAEDEYFDLTEVPVETSL